MAKADATAKLLPLVVAELVKRLPPADRAAIEDMIAGLATGAAEADRHLGGDDPSVESGARHLHLAAHSLLNRIAGPPVGSRG